jgi:dimethylamine monooxygenase subunit A
MNIPDDLFANPFRMQPGLKRITNNAPHFTPIKPGDKAFEEKLAVLRDATQDGLLVAPDFDAMPALRRALDMLAREHPQHVQADENAWYLASIGVQINRHTGACLCDSLTHPELIELIGVTVSAKKPAVWAALSLSVLEDLAVLCAPQGELNLLAVCLPSHWAPRDKIGKPFVQVHAPVADNALLLQAAQGLMRLVTAKGDDRWERYVWTMTPSMQLDGHPARCHREWLKTVDDQALLRSAVFRLERQTFIALPDQQQAIFTIAVHTSPLLDTLNPSQLAALRASLATMSDAVLDYRSFTSVRDAWLRALDAIEKDNTVIRIG